MKLWAIMSVLIASVVGCNKPATAPPYKSLSSAQEFSYNHIRYRIPSGFSIERNMEGEVVIAVDNTKNFGISHLRPKVAKPGQSLSGGLINILPLLRKDLEKEGKQHLQRIDLHFGKSSFSGYSYQNEYNRDNLDGYLIVGKYLLDIRIFLPKAASTGKELQTREALLKILADMSTE